MKKESWHRLTQCKKHLIGWNHLYNMHVNHKPFLFVFTLLACLHSNWCLLFSFSFWTASSLNSQCFLGFIIKHLLSLLPALDCTYLNVNISWILVRLPCSLSRISIAIVDAASFSASALCCLAKMRASRQARAFGSPFGDVPAHTAQPGHPWANGPLLHACLEPRDHRHLCADRDRSR